MGSNCSSSDNTDDEFFDEDNASDAEEETEKEIPVTLDLSSLFDVTLLRVLASKIKEEIPDNVLHQHSGALIKWLEEKIQQNQETVTLHQFCSVLMNRSVEREECFQAFKQFDSEGDGTADVSTMLEALKSSSGNRIQEEIAHVVRTLQACSLLPGFIDVYNEDKSSIGQHGARLLNFLLRNRAPVVALPFPILNGFNNTVQMRLTTLDNLFNKLKENVSRCEENILHDGEEVRAIDKCFSLVDVSSNKADAYRMFAKDFASYWQSDGQARSHWIRLKMKNNVVVKQLSIGVASSDQSYMPNLVTVSVGKSPYNLREIQEVRIPSHTTGDVILAKDLKVYYPIVQINIKRCQSDGCDTRIHHCKVLGYKIVKEAGVSVTDASVAWYLQILASTTLASMTIAPHLRNSILQQTKYALSYMPPLSLAPSSEKPSFMSAHVLKEIDQFLNSVAWSGGNICTEGLEVLLAFNLARGHIAATIDTIIQIQANPDLDLDTGHLCAELQKVRDNFWKKQGGLLFLNLVGCDGGQKDETSGPNNVVGVISWSSTQAYLTADGKTKVNMFFSGPDHVQITKIRIKVSKGPGGPKCGMVFVYNHEGKFDLDEQVKRFAEFDEWRSFEYNFCNGLRHAGITEKEDIPVAYFKVEDDWEEVEVSLDTSKVGKYVLVKFLEPRHSSAERLGIMGIRFYGFHRKAIFLSPQDMERLVPFEKHELITTTKVVPRVLSFFAFLVRDQDVGEKRPLNPRPHNLDVSNLYIGLMWKLYNAFSDTLCKILSLQLLHGLFPFLASIKDQNREYSEEFFQYLCSLVDSEPGEGELETRLHTIARQVIIDGAAVFFHDKEARRKQLFSMMTNCNTLQEATSVTLTFQSLCQFFSSVDPSGLLDLPNTITEEFNQEPVLQVLETLISVAYTEFQKVLDTVEQTEQAAHLIQLLCSLQTSLFSWAHRQITGENKEHSLIGQNMLIQYTNLLSVRVCQALRDYATLEQNDMVNLMSKLENSFLSTVLGQMVLIMTLLADHLASPTRTKILHEVLSICREFQVIAPKLPQVFYKVDSEAWKAMEGGEVILRTWDVESTHNYNNNMHVKQVFTCPGATSFTVEFDPLCETEKRYDYLEFTDSRGVRKRYDEKVGTEKWPSKVTFKSVLKLQFLFHSDSSNNEWGYKFKVIAKGCPDVPMCWLFDVQLSLAKLAGRLCGTTLDVSRVLPRTQMTDVLEEAESDLLKSELWKTLFRGGYNVGKLQRSLSGRQITEDSEDVVHFLSQLSQPSEVETLADKFYKRCQESCKVFRPDMGGPETNLAIRAVFAALIWHTQQLREDVDKYVKMEGECSLTEGLIQAFSIAESLRLYYVEKRQRLKVMAENSQGQELYDPVVDGREKALFLLKFAGLSKLHLKQEFKVKNDKKPKLYNRIQLHMGEKVYKLDIDKYPSFRLVLDFVRDPAWSKQRVEQLLHERCEQAFAVSEVYMAAAEYIRLTGEESIFQVPIIVFLQEMFSYQERFAKHYADGLDGCGLELESKVRRSFYTLIRRIVDFLRPLNRLELSRPLVPCYDFLIACMLHLLDVNWQFQDLFLLVDLKLPELYIKLAKGSVSMRENVVAEIDKEKELEEYKQNMKWQKQCENTSFFDWYQKQTHSASKESKKAIQMFIGRFCDLLDVEITCDGCGETLPGRRYRCLQCMDMDLCSTCFAGGVKPDGEHTDDHEIVHLQYKCDECYAFIVGTRIHCNQCENFDLCLGCHITGHFPAGHTSQHSVEIYPMVKWKTAKQSDSSVMSYIHQHVWMSYCSLALCMAKLLYQPATNTNCTNTNSPDLAHQTFMDGSCGLDPDYVKTATQLYNTSIELAVKCLTQVSLPDDVDTDNDDSLAAMEARQEEAFAVHTQERIMGLLGAMIPSNNKTPLAEDVSLIFTSVDFLSILFYIATGQSGHEANTQHYAVGLMGQLLQRTSTQCSVVDAAVTLASDEERMEKDKNKDLSVTADDLLKTINLKSKFLKTEKMQMFAKMTSEDELDIQKICSDSKKLEASLQKANQSCNSCHVQDENHLSSDPVGSIFPLDTTDNSSESPQNDAQNIKLDQIPADGSSVDNASQVCQKMESSERLKEDSSGDKITESTNCTDTVQQSDNQKAENCKTENTEDNGNGSIAVGETDKLEDDTVATDGSITANFLFRFGANCLERSELDWANFMASIINKLFNTPAWKPVLLKHLSSLIDKIKQNPQLPSIFALFVVAGFPEVLSVGSHVRYLDIGTEMKEGVVLKHFPDKNYTLLVDVKSRKRKTVKDEYIECLYEDVQILDQHHIASFVELVTSITEQLQRGKQFGVASMWVLALTLKALAKTLSVSTSPDDHKLLYMDHFLQCIVYLASQGTGFSRQWLLQHLEMLSVTLYTREHDEQEAHNTKTVDEPASIDKLFDKENCPPEDNLKNLTEQLTQLTRCLNSDAMPVSVCDGNSKDSFVPLDSAGLDTIDTGVQMISIAPDSNRHTEKAEEEPPQVVTCPPCMADNDFRNNTQKRLRAQSNSLFKKELERKGKQCNKDYLVKLNRAISILYARQVLTAVLADWPDDGHKITAQLLGCQLSFHLPFVLDLLHRPESPDMFKKVVQNLIKYSDNEELVPIAMTACQFMEDVTLSTITKESPHNYENDCHIEEKIHIPGAPYLTIEFDPRCATEEGCDELTMASSDDYKHDRHVFSGPRDRWNNFDMPGDTLYYKFVSDTSNIDWGYRFTVVGGRMGRFDTGYMILSALLLVPNVIRSVPLDKLWQSLVYVACKQTGQQRLKAIQLMLKLIQAHFRNQAINSQPLDLSLLRPLWLLYCKMTAEPKGGSGPDNGILPSCVRALTELFLRAEELAMDWGMEVEFAASLQTPEEISQVTYQGLLNVAAVSEMIGWENEATRAFKELRQSW